MKLLLRSLLLFSIFSVSAEQAVITTQEQRGTEGTSQMESAATLVTAQSYSTDVWFQSLQLELSGDNNNNGFYHQLYLKFDANTNRSSQAVWAEFSLQRPGRPEQLFYISSIFSLYRHSSSDWLAIDTTLEDSFVTGYYDLIIRLYDANSGWLLAEISGYDELILADLPLEDYQRDRPAIVVVESYGGSLGIFTVIGLAMLFWRRQSKGAIHIKNSRKA
ncbi:hypothetical protein GCM10010919_22880 [Alishewanella longhuensis]|uniref:GlyGly-CTERM sorting domain-containing protein n=1 Tax=Alishewanella longhuensis TaxID=1091037 RepID=A0ABQ3L0I9_9ALTE|nr:choice-of-anchor H family protein [Alishewanella longhuensis]GHG71512.1 hypothetical protein GCM10010919_22880 [Alishewanella longhuensis]